MSLNTNQTKPDCLNCGRYIGCRDPKRQYGFSCSHFKAKGVQEPDFIDTFGESAVEKKRNSTSALPDNTEHHELELSAMLNELLNPKNAIPYDLKVDDRDLPEFPNFFEFCASPKGVGENLFARQMTLATHIFGEWCPRCSAKAFRNIERVPVDYKTATLPEKVAFLEFGVCPRCKATKSELVASGELNFYSELAAVIGQRAGKSSLLAIMLPYIIHKYLKMQNPPQVLGLMRNALLVGTVTALTYSKAYELIWVPVHNILSTSPWFCLAGDMRVRMANGELKPIQEIAAGEYVATLLGPRRVNKVYDNGRKPCVMLKTQNGLNLIGTPDHRIGVVPVDRIRSVATQKRSPCLITQSAAAPGNIWIDHVELNWVSIANLNIDHAIIVEPNRYTRYGSGFGPLLRLNVAHPQVAYSHITARQDMGTRLVYDLEVEEAHHYFAEGMLVHNCSYHELMNHYAHKYSDESLFKFKDAFVSYRHRSIFCHPAGPNKRTMRGATRFFAVCDELSWMDNSAEGDAKERMSANEVYTSLDRSLKTVRMATERLLSSGYDNIINAYALNISSPSDVNDKVMSLVRTHRNSTEVYTVHLPTWEFNPLYTKQSFSKEYRDNPVTAERDFGANPPLNENPFLTNESMLYALCGKHKNRVAYKYKLRQELDTVYNHAEISKLRIPDRLRPAILTLDGGFSKDSFALCVASRIEPKPGVNKPPKVVIEALVEVMPRKNKSVVNFNFVFNSIILPIIEDLNVQYVVADRWQSLKLLHDIQHECGIHTDTYSLTYNDFNLIRDHLNATLDANNPTLLYLPKRESSGSVTDIDPNEYPHVFAYRPVDHLLFQMLTVSDTGRQVIKGRGYTDDIFRTFALALKYLYNDDFVYEHLNTAPVLSTANTNRVIGVVGAGNSTGGSCQFGAVAGKSGGGGYSGGNFGAVSSRGK